MAETARLVAFVADQFGMDSLDAARDAAPGQVQPFVHGYGTPRQALP